MINALVGLSSKNDGATRQLRVWAVADEHGADTQIVFTVGGVGLKPVSAKLGADEQKQIILDHDKTGTVWVIAKDATGTATTRKLLDLDAQESF